MHLSRIRPRFTVRRLMIAVAIVGFLMGSSLWVVKMRSRSADYRRRAHDLVSSTGHFWNLNYSVTTKDGRSVSVHETEDLCLHDAWARGLAEKYWQLSLRPWLPVEPDRPCPQAAHPRSAVDCPAEIHEGRMRPECQWYARPVYPWWTIPWTWGTPRMGYYDARWSFP